MSFMSLPAVILIFSHKEWREQIHNHQILRWFLQTGILQNMSRAQILDAYPDAKRIGFWIQPYRGLVLTTLLYWEYNKPS